MQLNGNVKTLLTRLAETAIIGGVLLWGTVQTIGTDVENIKNSVTEIKAEVRKIRDDFYVPRYQNQSFVGRNHPALNGSYKVPQNDQQLPSTAGR